MAIVRMLAQILSFVFHPLLVPTYMLVLLLLVNPYLFGVHSVGEQSSKLLIIQIFLYTFFIPALSFLLFRALGLVKSLDLSDRLDRTGPYILTGIFYLWVFYNLQNNGDLQQGRMAFILQIPTAYISFILGATLGLFIAFFINIFSKISIHAVGMGGLLGMVVITMMLFSYGSFTLDSNLVGTVQVSMTTIMMVAILLAGAVGTSRLILQDHDFTDLFGGYLVGFATQFIALRLIF